MPKYMQHLYELEMKRSQNISTNFEKLKTDEHQ